MKPKYMYYDDALNNNCACDHDDVNVIHIKIILHSLLSPFLHSQSKLCLNAEGYGIHKGGAYKIRVSTCICNVTFSELPPK